MVRSVVAQITADYSGLERGVNASSRILNGLDQRFTQSGRQIGSSIEQGTGRARDALGRFNSQSTNITGQIQATFAKAFAVDQILSFGNAIVSTTGKFEKYQSVLTNALGSRSAAKGSQNLIADFAAATPNSVKEITEDFVKLVNRGITPTRQQLTNLGDLAASQGKGFDQLTEAVLDAQSGEFERLKEFGIRASKSGDQVSLSFKGVTQTVKATSGEITNAILKFGQMSGVQGSMAAVSLTLEGQISNLGDSFDRLLVALGNAGVAGGFKFALSAAQQFLGVMTDLISNSPADEFRKEQAAINGLVGAIALANNNEQVRLGLITSLNQQYPEFLGKLNAESVSTGILETRLAAVNAQYDKKIRIALGEQQIKKANEAFTASIDQQRVALQMLATQSGKTITELEKLTPKQQVDLAKQIGERNKVTQFRPSYFGQSAGNATDYLASTLQAGMSAQASAQKELNRLLGENAIRQADLTKTTVNGYQEQIKQIKEKIRLHQIDKTVGTSEIARLNSEIDRAKGIAPKLDTTPIGATKSKGTATASGSYNPTLTTNEGILRRLTYEIKQQGSAASEALKHQRELFAQLVEMDKERVSFKPVDLGDNLKTLTPTSSGGAAVPQLPYLKEFMEQAQQDVDRATAFFNSAKIQLAHAGAGVLSGIGESIGKGENPLKGALQNILNIIGDFLIQLGEAVLFAGKLQEGAAVLSGPLAPLFALQGAAQIAAGAGLIVGGGVVKGLASLEKGGLAKGRSIVEVGETAKALRGGGEWISPIGEGAKLMTQEMGRMGAFGSMGSQRTDRLQPTSMNISISGDLRTRISSSDLLVWIDRAVANAQALGNGSTNKWRK